MYSEETHYFNELVDVAIVRAETSLAEPIVDETYEINYCDVTLSLVKTNKSAADNDDQIITPRRICCLQISELPFAFIDNTCRRWWHTSLRCC